MTASDQGKVLRYGFIIIRERDIHPIQGSNKPANLMLVCKSATQPEWHILEKDFPTKTARNRRKKEMLKESKVVED